MRAPRSAFSRTAWYTSLQLADNNDDDGNFDGDAQQGGGKGRGREITSRDAWGGGQYTEEYDSASPCEYTVLPQIRLEPILHARAKALNPDGVVNGAQVVGIEEGGILSG